MRLCVLVLSILLAHGAVATTLIVGMEDTNNRPFEYYDEAGNLTGFHVEVVQAVVARLGWSVEFRHYPWKRAMYALESGEVDAVTYVAQSGERERFAYFHPDNILHDSHTALYIRRTRAAEIRYIPPLDVMIRRWRIAAPSGYYLNDEIVSMIKRNSPIEQPTVTQTRLFAMLLGDRYDAVFGSIRALDAARSAFPDIDKHIQPLEGAIFPGKQMYVTFSRKTVADVAVSFADAYRAYRATPAYRDLAAVFGVVELLPNFSPLQPSSD